MFGKERMNRSLAHRIVSTINNVDPCSYKELVTVSDIIGLKPFYRSTVDKAYELYALHACNKTILVRNNKGEIEVDLKPW